jgi:hypothetical protein
MVWTHLGGESQPGSPLEWKPGVVYYVVIFANSLSGKCSPAVFPADRVYYSMPSQVEQRCGFDLPLRLLPTKGAPSLSGEDLAQTRQSCLIAVKYP